MYLLKENNRFKTFWWWPHDYISPKILAKLGFYYLGYGDAVKCIFCDIIIQNWKLGDNEFNEHYKYSQNCPLLRNTTMLNVALEPKYDLNVLLSFVPRTQKIQKKLKNFKKNLKNSKII